MYSNQEYINMKSFDKSIPLKYIYKFIQSINPWSYYTNIKLYMVLLFIQLSDFVLGK